MGAEARVQALPNRGEERLREVRVEQLQSGLRQPSHHADCPPACPDRTETTESVCHSSVNWDSIKVSQVFFEEKDIIYRLNLC